MGSDSATQEAIAMKRMSSRLAGHVNRQVGWWALIPFANRSPVPPRSGGSTRTSTDNRNDPQSRIVTRLAGRFAYRGGGTRTPGLRFWRPPLYQLSYAPRSGKVYRRSSRRSPRGDEGRGCPSASIPDPTRRSAVRPLSGERGTEGSPSAPRRAARRRGPGTPARSARRVAHERRRRRGSAPRRPAAAGSLPLRHGA